MGLKRKPRKVDPYRRLFQPNIPLSSNTDPRIDLTPPDLCAAGYIVRPHRFAGFWCWWYALPRGGQEFGEPRVLLEAVYASARWRMRAMEEWTIDDWIPFTYEEINNMELEMCGKAGLLCHADILREFLNVPT